MDEKEKDFGVGTNRSRRIHALAVMSVCCGLLTD